MAFIAAALLKLSQLTSKLVKNYLLLLMSWMKFWRQIGIYVAIA